MISSSSLTHFKPRFFSTVDISAAVCEAQRVGSWPYKAMSALTRAGLMTLSPSWHYYHSQAQARDITPTKNNWKGELKEKEWCLFLAQCHFTAAFRSLYPFIFIYTRPCNDSLFTMHCLLYTVIPEHRSVIMRLSGATMTPDSLTPSPPPSTILILRRLCCRGETRSWPKQSWSVRPHLLCSIR